MKVIKVDSIIPDSEQPRKLFEANKLSTLSASIKKHGIMTPLTLEDLGNSKYLIVDGERRFRCAKDLGLKEVPAIVVKQMSETERLIQQFHLQEQHEKWSATEKAYAILKLVDVTNYSLIQVCESLGLKKSQVNVYLNFGKLVSKEAFVKHNLNLDWASAIIALHGTVKKVYHNDLKKEYTDSARRRFENVVIEKIVKGNISEVRDIGKLKDTFNKDSKMIEKFETTDVTPEEMFLKTGAQDTNRVRQITTNCSFLVQVINSFMVRRDAVVSENSRRTILRAYNSLASLLKTLEN